MRLFAAVTPPEDAVTHLADHIAAIRDAGLRWSDATTWHVTTAFYGEVADSAVAELQERLARAARRHHPMSLRLGGAGQFGGTVLWVGIRGDVEELRRLAAATVAAGRRLGLGRREPRRYRPHVTLARNSARHNVRPCMAALSDYDGPTWRADHLTLVRSHLGAGAGGRALHEPVARFPLTE
ncbi:RNA 2',3'-cyclic phosphodiesterase [Phytoactinopolyspora limicola]|uniref:RNA 2',3'-cyclic phosphodiesterase n=1 Tax=Phytoactinopolyspora limicola TaxID=2715536 RepID=UPI001409D33E|nr:RNA 2',3'-cyclic phosphodiesterase [Phytoactinopolyspora limicola]